MSSIVQARRTERIQALLRDANLPPSYLRNTQNEESALEFTEQFETIHRKYFPNRHPLLLTCFNEGMKKKLICTFIRPTLIPYDELFDLEGCSKYVAGYVEYELLHDAPCYDDAEDDTTEKLPTHVVSPATTLQWQKGNCLEMSVLLTSLLCGAGYNAYVVVGYANKFVCLNDRTERFWKGQLPVEINSDEEDEVLEPLDAEYAALLNGRPGLRGTSDSDPAYVSDDDADEPEGAMRDLTSGDAHGNKMSKPKRNVHCWVAVLPGGRKSLTAATFVEPSTGELISTTSVDYFYTGVETVFNERQLYVNMSPEALVSSLSLDLRDASQWESIFPRGGDREDNNSDGLGGNFSQTTSLGVTTTARKTVADMVASLSTEATREFPHVQVPHSWVTSLTLTRQQFESRYPGGMKEIVYADAIIRLYAEYSQSDLRIREVTLSDTQYRDAEQIHYFYKHRLDKLRRRSVYPHAPDVTSPRGAQLGNSHLAPYRLLREWYEKGRMREATVEGLRELVYEPGVQRTMKFSWGARKDGMWKRVELLYDSTALRKVKQFYKGRTDHMVYRSASYAYPKTVKEVTAHQIVVNAGTSAGLKEYPRLEPIRMSQKFSRNPAVPLEEDVAKTTFLRPPPTQQQQQNVVGEMWVYFQYPETSIIRPYRMYAKPSSKVEDYIAASSSHKHAEPPVKVVTMPGATTPTDLQLHHERKWLNGVEVTCAAEIRGALDDSLDILVGMERDHREVVSMLSAYDTLRNRPKETEAERARKVAEATRKAESRKDYLAPYIAKLELPAGFDGDYTNVKLSMEQAKQVRDEALLELKDRLVQRGHIMQTRMDNEKADFARRQLLYQKNSDAAAVAGSKDAQSFALYCKDATWRMKVLDERLARHIDLASEKYALLAQRLSEDPRLASLYRP